MQLVIAYIASVVVFLALDFVALTQVIKPHFESKIGDWLLDSPRYGPAAVFYLFYVAGVIYFVVNPALSQDWSWARVFLTGAFLGALAYGTYEFTNLATLTRWSWSQVALDFTWGAVLTGVVGSAGVFAARLWA